MYDNSSFILLKKLISIITNKVNISGVTIFFLMNKYQKQPGYYFDGSVFLWHLRLCQYSHNRCIIRSFMLLKKLSSIIANKVSTSSLIIIIHVMNKLQKQSGDYFNGSLFLLQFGFCQYSHNS